MSRQSKGSGSACQSSATWSAAGFKPCLSVREQAHAVITLVSSQWTRQSWPHHDHATFRDAHNESLAESLICLQGQDEREQQVRADLAAEKEQLRKHHDRELRTLREQYENSQVPLSITAWCSAPVRPQGASPPHSRHGGAEGPALVLARWGLKQQTLMSPQILALCCHVSGCLDARCFQLVQ